jgi:antitoxin ParD1/3/4
LPIELKLELTGADMPTRNINLTPQLDGFVEAKIRQGQYANASEVLRAGLRALEQNEREDQARLEGLRAALIAGEESGIADGDVIGEVRERIRRRALVTGMV